MHTYFKKQSVCGGNVPQFPILLKRRRIGVFCYVICSPMQLKEVPRFLRIRIRDCYEAS